MKEIVASGKFKKDLKRYRGKPETLRKLYEVVGISERGLNLPKHYKPHMLVGEYSGHMECHFHPPKAVRFQRLVALVDVCM